MNLFLKDGGPKDWPEDFDGENGCYANRCRTCGEIFHGHKRRQTCKECARPLGHKETGHENA